MKGARIASERASLDNQQAETVLERRQKSLLNSFQQLEQQLAYFEKEGSLLAEQILKVANGGFTNGEIDFFQYIQSIENAYAIRIQYLEVLNDYNQTVITLNYLTFNP